MSNFTQDLDKQLADLSQVSGLCAGRGMTWLLSGSFVCLVLFGVSLLLVTLSETLRSSLPKQWALFGLNLAVWLTDTIIKACTQVYCVLALPVGLRVALFVVDSVLKLSGVVLALWFLLWEWQQKRRLRTVEGMEDRLNELNKEIWKRMGEQVDLRNRLEEEREKDREREEEQRVREEGGGDREEMGGGAEEEDAWGEPAESHPMLETGVARRQTAGRAESAAARFKGVMASLRKGGR